MVFNATLAEMNTLFNEQIEPGAQLIINIPKQWGDPVLLDWAGFDAPITVNNFPDGSSQIVGNLTAALDGDAKTIQFSSVAPTITDPKMYLMYILANGFATGDGGPVGGFSIGPLSEVVLQVCPTTGGSSLDCPP